MGPHGFLWVPMEFPWVPMGTSNVPREHVADREAHMGPWGGARRSHARSHLGSHTGLPMGPWFLAWGPRGAHMGRRGPPSRGCHMGPAWAPLASQCCRFPWVTMRTHG